MQSQVSRRALIASLVGTTIEWYDYFLYGTMAALVFNSLFFQSENPVVGLILSFASFAVAFFVRPLGGVIFSHFGDKIGRKKMLILTLFLMGGATILIGLLPTYEVIGVWAPILLVTLRIVQGIAMGGEWGGAILLAVEYAPEGKRGFFGSVPQMGSPIGMLLGTLVVTIVTSVLSESQFLAWGWRIPFILSIFLVFVGLWIRKGIDETPVFKESQKKGEVAKVPLFHTLRYHWKAVLIAVGAKVVETGPYFIFAVFIITYATKYLGYSSTIALNAVTLGALVAAILIPFVGALSDRIGRKPLFIWATVVTILFAFPYFYIISLGSAWLIIGTMLAFALWVPTTAVLGTLFSEIFSTNVRYTGISIGYMIGGALFGGTAPLIATLLLDRFNDSSAPVALFIIVMGVISLIAIFCTRETKDVDFTKEDSKKASV
jgi:metabolite-proton symporter